MSLWICLRWRDAHESTATDSQAALQSLALAMLQYSPQVACFQDDAVVLEISAGLSLFNGLGELCRRVRRSASVLEGSYDMSLAPSAAGAWLLAGSTVAMSRRVVRISSLARNLDRLPLDCLPQAHAHRRWLEGIGCRTLGALRALPRQGLQQRTQPELIHALDAAYAQTPPRLTWFVPPSIFRLTREPDFHLSHDTAVLAMAQPLLHALCGWLQHRQEALHDLILVLHHEKGRHACEPTRVALRFSAATWRLEDFNRLLEERLRHIVLNRAAVRLELISGTPHPRAPVNDTLFPDPARQADDERRLLDLLAARLGSTVIRRPRPRIHHLPELANSWIKGHPAAVIERLPTAAKEDRPRPFWLLSAPVSLDVRQERPIYHGQPLRLVQGPERIETGWHEGVHHRRDYFVAEDPQGARYWVYREREAGHGWFLHGLFA